MVSSAVNTNHICYDKWRSVICLHNRGFPPSIKVYKNNQFTTKDDEMIGLNCVLYSRHDGTVVATLQNLFGGHAYYIYDGTTKVSQTESYRLSGEDKAGKVTIAKGLMFHSGKNIEVFDAKTLKSVRSFLGPFLEDVNIAVIQFIRVRWQVMFSSL